MRFRQWHEGDYISLLDEFMLDGDIFVRQWEFFIAHVLEPYLKMDEEVQATFNIDQLKYMLKIHDQERLQGLSKYAFLTTGTPAQRKTAMQQFLGAAIFFRPAYVYATGPKSAIPDRTQLWTELTGSLYETTNKDFNWDSTTYVTNYAAAFARLQKMLLDASRIFFPDYTLP